MKCPHCGQDHPDEVKICPITGQALVEPQPKAGIESTTITNNLDISGGEPLTDRLSYKKTPAPIRSMRRRQWLKFISVVLLVVIGVAILAAGLYFVWHQISSRQESQAASVAVQISIGLTQTAMALTTNISSQPSATALPTDTLIPTMSLPTTTISNQQLIATQTMPASTLIQDQTITVTVAIPSLTPGSASTPPLLPTATLAVAAPVCPGTLPSRLSPGVNAKVSDVVFTLNMRVTPGVNSLVVGNLKPNDQVLILNDPPICADNYLWWHIQSTDATSNGWAAEGGGNQYWLIP